MYIKARSIIHEIQKPSDSRELTIEDDEDDVIIHVVVCTLLIMKKQSTYIAPSSALLIYRPREDERLS